MHTVLFFIIAIALLIAVHEYGHFITARRLGIKVEKFSIGFGPSLLSWRSRDGEVEYVIAAIPLGGFVKMLGEGGVGRSDDSYSELSAEERARAFDLQPVWRRAAVAVAGPLFNFLFAVVAYMVIAWIGQSVYPPQVGYMVADGVAAQAGMMVNDRVVALDGEEVHSWHELELVLKQRVGTTSQMEVERGGSVIVLPVAIPGGERDPLLINVATDRLGIGMAVEVRISGVVAGQPAQRAGVREGDRVLSANGRPVYQVGDLIDAIQHSAGEAITLQVQQPQEAVRRVTVTPLAGDGGDMRIGVHLAVKPQGDPVSYRMGLFEGVAYGFTQTWSVTLLTMQVLGKMVSAAISPENLGGPIAIAQMAGRSAELGLVPFLAFLALISVNLGVLNLLPIPVLDGGHLLYLTLEKLRGRPLSQLVLERVQLVGVVLISSLMLFAFYNDIARWLRG
ncbi:MAG: RIP metalloprotease RseP [Mariprofundales bacterium]|nr:RIP metalloprotease RseP [Mariprofundales bacterium]